MRGSNRRKMNSSHFQTEMFKNVECERKTMQTKQFEHLINDCTKKITQNEKRQRVSTLFIYWYKTKKLKRRQRKLNEIGKYLVKELHFNVTTTRKNMSACIFCKKPEKI